MPNWAVAVRRPDGGLRLFWRVRRCPQGHIYVMFSAGQDRPRASTGKSYDPHTSWHLDGRYHNKSYDEPWQRQQRQRLDAFTGTEYFIATSVDQMLAAGLPNCVASQFDQVLELNMNVLDRQRQQLQLALVSPGLEPPPAVGPGERSIERWTLADRLPWIVVTLYDYSGCFQPATQEPSQRPS